MARRPTTTSIRQGVRKWLERVAPWDGGDALPAAQVARQVRALLDAPLQGPSGRLLHERLPGAVRERLAAADRVHRDLDHGDPIDWHLDPASGRRAPLAHWSRLDPRDAERVGDARVIWELNRHHVLVTLAQAYALRGDERDVARLVDLLDGWIAANPVGQGINWTSSLEVALRLISWCWVLRLTRHSPTLAPRLPALVRALAAHAGRVERFLSRSLSPDLTGEALGLCCAGATLAELEPAARWRRTGARILERELLRQVSEDGVHVAQTTCAQRTTVEIYLHWLLLARGAVPAWVGGRVQAMLDYLLHVRRPDGTMPSLGDAGTGWLLPLCARDPDDLRGVFALAAAWFHRPDYAWAAGGLQPETLWHLGTGGAAAFAALHAGAPVTSPSRLFSGGGWAVLRDGWGQDGHHLLFAAAPLAVQASFFGEPILVDAGAAPLGGKARPAAGAARWTSSPELDMVSASHDAHRGPGERLGHRRTALFARPGRFVLIDELTGTARHQVELRFQLAPGARVTCGGAWALVIGAGGRGVSIGAFAAVPLELHVEEGWVSLDHGRRVASPVLCFSARARLPLRIVTYLLPKAHPHAESLAA